MRLVVHAGFHKTGTSSVQALLHHNRTRLEPHLRIALKPDFEALTRAARHFSVAPDAVRLADVGAEAAHFFETLDSDDPRPVLMSSEDLSGHMPGRRGLESYDAVDLILPQIADAAFARFGETLDLVFYFSTRAARDWLRSAWWQSLRGTRLVLDCDAYSAQFAAAAAFDTVLAAVADSVAPARIATCALEDSSERPQGPLTPLLDLVDMPQDPRATLDMLPPVNTQPDLGLQPVMLALNRSGLKDRQVRELKRILRQMANRLSDKR